MLRLHRALDETVDVAVLEGAAVRFIDQLLSRQLDQIRIEGVAYDHQEHTQGISAVGAAVVGPSGPLLAISVPAPTERFAERHHEIVAALRRAVGEASALLDVG